MSITYTHRSNGQHSLNAVNDNKSIFAYVLEYEKTYFLQELKQKNLSCVIVLDMMNTSNVTISGTLQLYNFQYINSTYDELIKKHSPLTDEMILGALDEGIKIAIDSITDEELNLRILAQLVGMK